jgi:hypothetical protein
LGKLLKIGNRIASHQLKSKPIHTKGREDERETAEDVAGKLVPGQDSFPHLQAFHETVILLATEVSPLYYLGREKCERRRKGRHHEHSPMYE